MKNNIKSLIGLIILGFILSCAQAPQQIAKKALALTDESTVRLINKDDKSRIVGTGFFVDKNKIATNIHVVGKSGLIIANLRNQKKTVHFSIEGITAFDVKNNLVILKLSGEGKPLPLGDSDAVHIDETVSVIDYYNTRYKAKTGTIKSIQKSDKWLWTKVNTTRQSSGSPVLNIKGDVIGINVGYGDDSHNYVIPSNTLKKLMAIDMPQELLPEWQERKDIRAEVHYSQGEYKFANKAYKRAIDEFSKASALNPEHFRAFYMRAKAKFYINDYTGAIDDCTHAITLNPEYDKAYMGCCIISCKLGDTESEGGNTETARKLYYEGMAYYNKYVQLQYSMDTAASTEHISSIKGRSSTVVLMNVSGGFAVSSGFFVDTDKIATNVHVAARPGPIFAKIMDGDTIWEVLGVTAFDVQNDLAVLKITGEGTPLSLDDSNIVRKGQSVVAVGFPGGKYKVTSGKVLGIRNRDKWIRASAKIAAGNSGGPLLNYKGAVIGVNTRNEIYSAAPSNILKELLNQSVALEPLAQWQKRDHVRAHTYQSEGERRYLNKDYTGAIDSFDKAVLHNPKFILAWHWRGLAKKALGQHAAAKKDFKKAKELAAEK